MTDFKKITLVLPGWFTSLEFFTQNTTDFLVNVGKIDPQNFDSDYIIGMSLGSLVILRDIESVKGKIILVNPLVPKRSLLSWFARWLKYIFYRGLFLKRQKFIVNPLGWIKEIGDCISLLKIDFSETLATIHKDKIIVIKNRNDNFFCDNESLAVLNSIQIETIEIDGDHNWNEFTEEKLIEII